LLKVGVVPFENGVLQVKMVARLGGRVESGPISIRLRSFLEGMCAFIVIIREASRGYQLARRPTSTSPLCHQGRCEFVGHGRLFGGDFPQTQNRRLEARTKFCQQPGIRVLEGVGYGLELTQVL
jgi:hypothetical protein